jgi:hypothetical protein
MPHVGGLFACCAIVQRTTTKVRRAVAARNKQYRCWIQEQLLMPIRFVVG